MSDTGILCEACEKGKIVVNKCLKNGYDINTEKLEKLLIIMQGEMLRFYNKPFFSQPIIIANSDVIIPKVKESFGMYNDGFKEHLCEFYHLLSEEEEEIMNMVIKQYSNMDLSKLNEKIEIKILRNIFNDSKEEFNLVSLGMIENVFMRSIFFGREFIKNNSNNKQKVLVMK